MNSDDVGGCFAGAVVLGLLFGIPIIFVLCILVAAFIDGIFGTNIGAHLKP